MESIPSYEREPRRSELDTEIVASGTDGGRPWVVLADTILYPEGGGQPADRGTIAGVSVLDVRRTEQGIQHRLAAPLEGGPVHVVLNWERRFDHMQQHTAQHLLTTVAQDRFGWATTAFHLGEVTANVELDAPEIPVRQLRELEEAAAAEVRAARPVSVRWVERNQLEALKVRTRGLPEDHIGPVRLVEIAGLDLNTCGGTHVRTTAELEAVALIGTEPMRGGTRVHFVAGTRLRSRLARHEMRSGALRSLLGAPDEELADAAAAKLDQLADTARKLRATEGELAAALAESLAGRSENILAEQLGAHDASFLQRIARGVIERRPRAVVLLTAGSQEGCFALATGPETGVSTAELGPRVAEILGGRGGGSPGFFQGKASRLSRHPEAVVLLASHMNPEP